MAVTVGGVSIQIGVDPSGVAPGMNAAKSAVKAGVDTIQGTMDSLKTTLLSLGAGLTIGALAGWIKGAIEVADETAKMSQKLGLATAEVAGLQLAFRQAGVGDEFEKSITKMAKAAADGNEAFKAMGINVKDNAGNLKGTRALLGEVADAMAGYADGTAKTALAQEIFGKSGAQLIPLLNAGAAGLADYDEMAKKLGLTLSDETTKQAEKFNDTIDLMGQASQGVARQVAAELLPTLSGLADQFFTSMTSGDKLANTAAFMSNMLKVLYIAGVSVVEVFSTVGKTLGGVGAAVVAALSGDFAGAVGILKVMKDDIGTGWKDTLKQVQGAWDATGSASVESMASTQKALKAVAPLVKDYEAATKNQTKAIKDQEAAQKKADAELMKIMQARAAERKKEDDSIEEYMRAQEQARNATVKASNDAVAAAQEEYDNYGKTRSQIGEVTLARLEDKLQAYRAGSENARVVQLEIDNQKKLIDILRRGEVREASKAAADESVKWWQEAGKDIQSALTNSLMRGFESGKDMVTSLRDYIANAFKSLVVKIGVQGIMGGVGSLLGVGNAMAGGTGGGAGTDTGGVGMLSSLFGAGGAIANGISGVGAAMMNGPMSSLLGDMGASLVSSSSAIAGAVPYIGAALAAVSLLKSAMAYKVTPTGGGLTANLTSTGTSTGLVGQFNSFNQEGGFLGGGNTQNRDWSTADQGTTGYIIASVQAATAANKAYASVLGLNASAVDGFTKSIEINTTGMDEAAARAAINAEIAVFSSDMVSSAYGDALSGLALEGETSSATLQRLGGDLLSVNRMFESMGRPTLELSVSGAKAAQALLQTNGGLEALARQLQMVDAVRKNAQNSIYEMQYGMGTNRDKYNMLDVKAAGIDAQMRGATDIASISGFANQQIDLLNKAWGLLDANQQQASFAQFEEKLNAIDSFVADKGADALSVGQAKDDKTAKTIADAVAAAVGKALTDAETARQAKPAPEQKPVEVTVNVTKSPGVEVAVGYNGSSGGYG